MSVGRYANIPLQDNLDKDRNGAIFLLRKEPVQDVAIKMAGWTVEVSRGLKAVVVHGSKGNTFEDTFDHALLAANNGLDYMSFRGQCDVAIASAFDDCIVWWPESSRVVMRTQMTHTSVSHSSATVVAMDSTGREIPQAPAPTPLQHDAFRYLRMSRTSEYLYDSHRNMFLALESILSEIHPRTEKGERLWFRNALREAHKIEPMDTLAAPNVSNPLNWICNNLYSNERSGLMHAKSKSSYHLPQDHRKRERIESSLRRLSNYTISLLEKQLGITHNSSGLAQPGWEMMMKGFLPKMRLAITDDQTKLEIDSDAQPSTAVGSSVVVLNQGPVVADGSEPFMITTMGDCSRGDLEQLKGVYKIGLFSEDNDLMIAAEFFAGLHLGDDVDRFEVKLGMRNVNSTGPRSHFSA
ncbi:hypothetical protein [Nocardia sp. NPDC058705]|uniref:hypothetical protein n=1 Tax=Nocardia sp. NPDC058705 TaxID=3346609 RepID=UPI0036BB08D1